MAQARVLLKAFNVVRSNVPIEGISRLAPLKHRPDPFSMTMLRAVLPSTFWTIDAAVSPTTTILHCDSIHCPQGSHKSSSLCDVMSILQLHSAQILYEVLLSDAEHNMYFDIDKAWIGVPGEDDCAKALADVLTFLRKIIGEETRFAVSQSHRHAKISFHVVCPGIVAEKSTMRKIALLAQPLDIAVDTAVYKTDRQLMRSAFATGEKPDSIPLWPVHPYAGVFSDHIVQACWTTPIRRVSAIDIPEPPPRIYESSRAVPEDLIVNMDLNSIFFAEREGLMASLRIWNLRPLFDYKMIEYHPKLDLGGISNKARLEWLWNSSTSVPLTQSQLFAALKRTNPAKAKELLFYHHLVFVGDQLRGARDNQRLPEPKVITHEPAAVCTLIDEEREYISGLLDKESIYLARLLRVADPNC